MSQSFDELIDRYKAATGITTDTAVAESLGLARTAFANYRAGRRRLPDVAIARIFDATGLSFTEVLAAANDHWEGTPDDERPFWSQRLGALGNWRKW